MTMEMMTCCKLVKHGNSKAVIIPSEIIQELKLEEGGFVNLIVRNPVQEYR